MADLRLAFVNGKFVDAREASIAASDRGFLLGLGVFETLLVRERKAVFLCEHLERMEEGRSFLRIPRPRWNAPESVGELLRRAEVESAALRITLSRGVEGEPTLAIALRPLPAISGRVRLAVSRFAKSADDPWERIKTTSRARNAIAREEAEEAGAYDAIVRTSEGDFAEGTACNLYLVRRGVLFTPPLDRGILAGVTRGKILAGCRRLGIPLEERKIELADLREAEELLVSNSTGGLLEAEELIGVWKRGPDAPDRVSRALRADYEEQVKRDLEEFAR